MNPSWTACALAFAACGPAAATLVANDVVRPVGRAGWDGAHIGAEPFTEVDASGERPVDASRITWVAVDDAGVERPLSAQRWPGLAHPVRWRADETLRPGSHALEGRVDGRTATRLDAPVSDHGQGPEEPGAPSRAAFLVDRMQDMLGGAIVRHRPALVIDVDGLGNADLTLTVYAASDRARWCRAWRGTAGLDSQGLVTVATPTLRVAATTPFVARDASLRMGLAGDRASLAGIELSADLDARDLAPLFIPEGDASDALKVCGFFDAFGFECQRCADGNPTCLSFIAYGGAASAVEASTLAAAAGWASLDEAPACVGPPLGAYYIDLFELPSDPPPPEPSWAGPGRGMFHRAHAAPRGPADR